MGGRLEDNPATGIAAGRRHWDKENHAGRFLKAPMPTKKYLIEKSRREQLEERYLVAIEDMQLRAMKLKRTFRECMLEAVNDWLNRKAV